MSTFYIVSGGFDPIHEGHIENIKESAIESDGVIALVNSDEWLCRKKGKNFMNFYTRSTVVGAIKGVVEVIAFDDADNSACDGLRQARKLHPNDTLVFAKGGEGTTVAFGASCRAHIPAEKYRSVAKIVGLFRVNNGFQLHFNLVWIGGVAKAQPVAYSY